MKKFDKKFPETIEEVKQIEKYLEGQNIKIPEILKDPEKVFKKYDNIYMDIYRYFNNSFSLALEEDEAFKAVISCLNINHYQKYFDSKGLYSGIYPECGLFKIIIKTTSPNYANIKYKYRTIYNAIEQNRKSAEKHLLEKLFFFLKNGYKIYKKAERKPKT